MGLLAALKTIHLLVLVEQNIANTNETFDYNIYPRIFSSGSFQCRLGWHDSGDFIESNADAKGLVYKNVMAKTRKEKGKEAELHVIF
jgi:hypothetical protein